MDVTDAMREILVFSGRTVPSDFDMQSFSSDMMRMIDADIERFEEEAEHNTRVDSDAQIDSEMKDAPPNPSRSPSPASASSCISGASLLGLPFELHVTIFRHTARKDKSNLRLASRSLGRAGLEEMLVGTVFDETTGKRAPKPPIQLRFGVRHHDLVILKAILSKPEIASRVQTLSLGCAYFDRNDLSASQSDRRLLTFHCGDDRELGAGSNAVEWNHKDEIVELLDDVLGLLQKLNRRRRSAEKAEDRKPDVSVAFGCTTLPWAQNTLPHGLRKLVRDHPTLRIFSPREMDDICTDQARFLDWALFLLFGAMHRRTKDSFHDKAISIDFRLRGRHHKWAAPEISLRVDLSNNGTLFDLLNQKDRTALHLDRAKTKTTILREQLPPWNHDMDNKLRDLIESVKLIDLTRAGGQSFGQDSLWYSDLVQLLEPRLTCPFNGPLFSVINGEWNERPSQSLIYQIPFENIRRLDMSDFLMPGESIVAAILTKSK